MLADRSTSPELKQPMLDFVLKRTAKFSVKAIDLHERESNFSKIEFNSSLILLFLST